MITRSEQNPILTRRDIPAIPPHVHDVTSVFNPGAIKFNDEYLLMLRVQLRSRETFILTAASQDGVRFTVSKKLVHFNGIEAVRDRIYHIYDARITRFGDAYYIMFALDMDNACQLGLGVTKDFQSFEFLGIASNEDIRNGVLFPEKVDGKFSGWTGRTKPAWNRARQPEARSGFQNPMISCTGVPVPRSWEAAFTTGMSLSAPARRR